MSEPIFEISENGKNVLTCEDHEKVFSSKFKTLKTFNTYTMNAGDEKYHNLGYYPIFLHCNYLADKPLIVGLVGQNTVDFAGEVRVDDEKVVLSEPPGYSPKSLVYVFIESL